jgi:hypothetical protein
MPTWRSPRMESAHLQELLAEPRGAARDFLWCPAREKVAHCRCGPFAQHMATSRESSNRRPSGGRTCVRPGLRTRLEAGRPQKSEIPGRQGIRKSGRPDLNRTLGRVYVSTRGRARNARNARKPIVLRAMAFSQRAGRTPRFSPGAPFGAPNRRDTSNFQSRRGDSNPGPIHYEAWARVGPGGSDADVCRHYGRSRGFDLAANGPIRRRGASMRLPVGSFSFSGGAVGGCPSRARRWSWTSSTQQGTVLSIAADLLTGGSFCDRALPPNPGSSTPDLVTPRMGVAKSGVSPREAALEHPSSLRTAAAATSLLAG